MTIRKPITASEKLTRINVGSFGVTTMLHSARGFTFGNTAPGQSAYALPTSMRHGTQPHYWTEIWRRKEMLADLDILSNNVFDTDDMEDVIARLEAAASAAEAAKAY